MRNWLGAKPGCERHERKDPMEPLTVVGVALAVVAGLRATWSP
jgi:hypothetical protein